jgi:hypothetical protein
LHTTYSSGKPWTDSGSPVVGSQSLTLNLRVFRNVPLTAESRTTFLQNLFGKTDFCCQGTHVYTAGRQIFFVK